MNQVFCSASELKEIIYLCGLQQFSNLRQPLFFRMCALLGGRDTKDHTCKKSARQHRQTGFWKGKLQENQDCTQAKQMRADFLNCLRTAFIPIPAHCDCLPQAHRPGDWWAPTGVDPTPEGSFTEGLWWQQHKKEEDFHTAGLAPEVCSFDLSISPQQHHFSNPRDQGKEYLQSASCSAFVFICICCKRKTHLQ